MAVIREFMMKHCTHCGQSFSSCTWRCAYCGHEPPVEHGFRILAPKAIEANRSYDEQFHRNLAALESVCFWFRNRNRLTQSAVDRFFPDAESFFEIGCGTGFVLAFLAGKVPDLKLTAGGLCPSGLLFVAERVASAELLQVDAQDLPFQEEFDLIGSLNVIDHIDDDQRVLEQIHQSLKPGGGSADWASCRSRSHRHKQIGGQWINN